MSSLHSRGAMPVLAFWRHFSTWQVFWLGAFAGGAAMAFLIIGVMLLALGAGF